ncbi:MAG: type II toxin-antitoxin system RelE/ParE family toxin [Acidobacteriota bacterium]|nr:type II toxin-antitoxin system RelE/ParE family toxin [Acidobacteriota bacterium]
MTSAPVYEIRWTETAVRMLEEIGDRRIQQQLFDASKRLVSEPEKQGKALREGLLGFRSLRAIGQRHRLIYSLSTDPRMVFVVAAGLRREGARDDIYALAERLIRLGLAPPARSKRAKGSGGRRAGAASRKRRGRK